MTKRTDDETRRPGRPPLKKRKQVRPGTNTGVYFTEPEHHEIVKRAAELEGMSVSEFIVRAAHQRAERVVARKKAA